MKLDEETKSKINALPPILRMAVDMCLNCIDNIINGKCDEDSIASTVGTLNQNAQGKYSAEDLMSYDKAGTALGFGCTNRVGLKRLLNKHNIHEVKINNMCVGFPRSEIMALRDKLMDDIRKRNIKTAKKAVRNKNKNRLAKIG